MDDYHAFTSTTDGGSGCSGCSSGCLPGVITVLVILYLIGKVFV